MMIIIIISDQTGLSLIKVSTKHAHILMRLIVYGEKPGGRHECNSGIDICTEIRYKTLDIRVDIYRLFFFGNHRIKRSTRFTSGSHSLELARWSFACMWFSLDCQRPRY